LASHVLELDLSAHRILVEVIKLNVIDEVFTFALDFVVFLNDHILKHLLVGFLCELEVSVLTTFVLIVLLVDLEILVDLSLKYVFLVFIYSAQLDIFEFTLLFGAKEIKHLVVLVQKVLVHDKVKLIATDHVVWERVALLAADVHKDVIGTLIELYFFKIFVR
jgi:hypothetical protein